LGQRAIQITGDDTAGTLAAKLSSLGANLLLEILPLYLSDNLQPQPQADSLATYAPMIQKENGLLNFSQAAIVLERQIRAFNPWPGAFTYWNKQILKLHRAHSVETPSEPVGKMIAYQELPAITTGKGILVIDELQPAGKNILDGKTFLHGARNWGK
jgi:methionyl-tRNA formyltransferase